LQYLKTQQPVKMRHTLWLLVGIGSATPVELSRRSLSITPAIIQAISPNSASCAGAPQAGQCRTAAQAALPIAQSFSTYGITTPGEAAALISLMAYESADFKYQNNVSPGRPGQGTRNMQMINYNLVYVQSIPALASNLSAITGGAGATALSSQQANDVRSLLTSNDAYDFGSAAWFLTSQCSSSVRYGLQTGSLAGWQQYISSCVGAEASEDRQEYWNRAVTALA
jgi:hypothetical protein